jgi:hypothetical protein
MWQQSKYALDFFRDNKILFQDLVSSKNTNSLATARLDAAATNWLLSLPKSDVNIIYRKIDSKDIATITGLPIGKYNIKWYNPRTGGALQDGSILDIDVGATTDVKDYGQPPSTSTLDWVVYIRKI